MAEALKKRIEKLEEEKAPLITPEAKEIIDLLHRDEEFFTHPERFPPEDPEETERMLKDFLESDEARALQEKKRRPEIPR
jgi:hypothetical protein